MPVLQMKKLMSKEKWITDPRIRIQMHSLGAQILWWKHAFVHEWIDLLGYTLYQEWVMWATVHAKAGLDL